MLVGLPDAGQLNALATLNIRGERSVTCKGEFDRHPDDGPLPPGAPRCARSSAPARRPGTRRGARRHLRPRARPRGDAHVRRRLLVQGPLRHHGHAVDRRRRRPLRHRLPGRDHVLVEQPAPRARSSTPRRSTPSTTAGSATPAAGTPRRRCCCPRSGTSAVPGRQPGQRLRHHPVGVPGIQLGVRGVGERQPGHGEPRRGDAGVVPGTGQPQRGRARPPAQGDARVRRWCHRGGHPRRPHRDPRPHPGRRRRRPRRPERPGRGLLRPPRPVHDGAAVLCPARVRGARARVR